VNGRVARVLIGTAFSIFLAAPGAVQARRAVPVTRAEPTISSEVVPAASPIDVEAAAAHGVSREALTLALGAVSCATASGEIAAPPTLTLIDYSRPSTEPRLWVLDMKTGAVLFTELVAHGRNTGDNMAEHFSDAMNSRQSSIGLFVARDTYVGSNGYSLRMDGLEPGFNGRARERAIVMHGAPYVNASLAAAQGRIGRSWGCPALRQAVARNVIDTVRGGGVVFSYYPDQTWLTTSRFLNCNATGNAD
jgi:L,D-transpeptidase catalytic domain